MGIMLSPGTPLRTVLLAWRTHVTTLTRSQQKNLRVARFSLRDIARQQRLGRERLGLPGLASSSPGSPPCSSPRNLVVLTQRLPDGSEGMIVAEVLGLSVAAFVFFVHMLYAQGMQPL
jgi:hypothetical protein